MARRPHVRRVIAVSIQPYEVHDAINTVARARQHLSNPKMVRAMKDHLAGMNEAVTGGLRPKPLRSGAPGQKRPKGGL